VVPHAVELTNQITEPREAGVLQGIVFLDQGSLGTAQTAKAVVGVGPCWRRTELAARRGCREIRPCRRNISGVQAFPTTLDFAPPLDWFASLKKRQEEECDEQW